jgi:methylaspartate mutase epsilon subunit
LRQALTSQGYHVIFLGTQNRLRAFFEHQAFADAVLVSCMDGHARHYLREFVESANAFGGLSAFWYLGGRPSVSGVEADERAFREMGFRRVFSEFVDIVTVIELLAHDLRAIEPTRTRLPADAPTSHLLARPTHGLHDDALDLDVFDGERREVLEHWKTGARARELEDNASFLAAQPSFPRPTRGVGRS